MTEGDFYGKQWKNGIHLCGKLDYGIPNETVLLTDHVKLPLGNGNATEVISKGDKSELPLSFMTPVGSL